MRTDPLDISALTAAELAPLLRSGALSAEAVARACLARATERESAVRAWAHLAPDDVLARAVALDALPIAARGPLHGIPVGIKDIISTHGLPTRHNTPLPLEGTDDTDAACVALLRQAGALVFGKTETVEFGATGRVAETTNPLRPTHTPGGSSSGSAAAVADFHVPLALGTQTGGSIVRPASFCGIWALKPTWNLVSREGARMYAPSLDTIGWFARSVADLALVLDVVDPVPAAALPRDLAALRIAVCRSPAWDLAEPATRNALDAATAWLAGAGATVAPLDLPPAFDALPAQHATVMRLEGGTSFLAASRRFGEALHPSFRQQVAEVATTGRARLLDAYDQAARCRTAFDALAADWDAVLTPSVPGEAPEGLAQTGSLAFNAVWSLLHVPCINVPGWVGPGGLPVGLTLTGPRFSERRLLAVAAAIETGLSTRA